VNHGATTSFTLTPGAGYQIGSVTGTCGGSLAGNTYTTNAVTGNCTVIANFTTDTGISIPAGTHNNYTANLGNGVGVTFSQITGPCIVSRSFSGTPPGSAPPGYRFAGNFYDISHTGCSTSGAITITIPYNESSISGPEANLRIFHWESLVWSDVTTSVDTVNNTITGTTTSLSPFGAGYPYSGGYSTGVNIYMMTFLAFIAIFMGGFILRRNQRYRKI
jgi:hypothetical protein